MCSLLEERAGGDLLSTDKREKEGRGSRADPEGPWKPKEG